MHEIARTQAAAELTPALFEAMADVYAAMAKGELARSAPETIPRALELGDVTTLLRDDGRTNDGS